VRVSNITTTTPAPQIHIAALHISGLLLHIQLHHQRSFQTKNSAWVLAQANAARGAY
jgi:hypothetical protein